MIGLSSRIYLALKEQHQKIIYLILNTKTGVSDITFYYIHISGTLFELNVFWPSDTERRIKLAFSASVSLFLRPKLMALLSRPQETSNAPMYLHLKWNFVGGKGIE